jgi:YceI-like domain
MPVSGRWYGLSAMACLVLGVTIVPPRHSGASLEGQWVIDDASSLAWWQVNPHLGDLWGTTCPQESSWHAGRAQDPYKRTNTAYAAVIDTIIPLYPRPVAQSVCQPAVTGDFTLPDTVTWQGVKGNVAVDVFALTSGNNTRDTYARAKVFQSGDYPTIEFQVDSVVGIARHGDTLMATAVGLFKFVGVRRPTSLPVKAWREKLGLRVTGKGEFPATELREVFNISATALGMGVGTRIWKKIHWGLDAILVPDTGERQ